MNILLIWERVPDDTDLYIIPSEVATPFTKYLDEAHGKIINVDEYSDGLKFLNTALMTVEGNPDPLFEEPSEPGFEEHRSIFAQYKQNSETPIVAQIEKVYLSGFCM